MNVAKVLDHGIVKLIDSMGDDLSIVKAARVSFGQVSKGEEQDRKLIKYLLENRHTSPFEHVVFTFYVKCPIFVARQWMRHRTWSYNECSARYTQLTCDYYVPPVERIGTQDKKNKQGTVPFEDPTVAPAAQAMIRDESEGAVIAYKELLSMGVSRELARLVLPVNIYTEFYGTIDLHNLLHFFSLREHPHAQHEIQVYAKAIRELIYPVVPVTLNIWEEINLIR